jgi:starch synthase
MFPRNYTMNGEADNAFAVMAEDLDRVKELGYNVVYVNPFMEVGNYPKSQDGLVGSLYATNNLERLNPSLFHGSSEERSLFNENGDITQAGQSVKDFCEKAKESGLTPMFDLVTAQFSPDSKYIQDNPDLIAKHENGNFSIHNLDKNYNPVYDNNRRQVTPDLIWDDVLKINWEQPKADNPDEKELTEAGKNAIEKIFKPYVRRMAELGFEGVRIDAAAHIPAEAINQLTDEFKEAIKNKRRENGLSIDFEPVIFAEYLGAEPEKDDEILKHLNATAVTTSAYYFPNEYDKTKGNMLISPEDVNNPYHWVNKDSAVRTDRLGQGVALVPASSHDHLRLVEAVGQDVEKKLGITPDDDRYNEVLNANLRAKLAFSALYGDNWMLASGDEYLTDSPYATLEGKLVNNEKARAGQYVIGKDENGNDILLPADEYNELMSKTEIGKTASIEIEGQTFTFKKDKYFEKPVWQYKEGEEQIKQEHLVLLKPQFQITERSNSYSLELEDPNSLLSFIRDINQAKQLDKEATTRKFIGYSEQDADIMYFATTSNNTQTSIPSSAEILQIQAVNVNGAGKEITLSNDEIAADFKQIFNLQADLPEIELIGSFSVKNISQTPKTEVKSNTVQAAKEVDKILMVASEVFPYSKSGGLSKVVGDLSNELSNNGKEVVVITPWYNDLEKTLEKRGLSISETKEVTFPFDSSTPSGEDTVKIGEITENNVRYVFVKHEDFERDNKYGYEDDAIRFARFSRAVPNVAEAIGFEPDLVHAHDWQTGMLPLILKHSDPSLLPDSMQNVPTVLTIHRGEFFGEMTDPQTMVSLLRLPGGIEKQVHMEYHGMANPLWTACGSSDAITTVSPTYAEELTAPEGYMSMNYHIFKDKITGIVNGIDTETMWNPEKNPYLIQDNLTFSQDDLTNKQALKEKLCQDFGITDSTKPLIGIVSRISDEKGVGLVAEAADELIQQGWNVVIGGTGSDKKLLQQLEEKTAEHQGSFAFKNGWVDAPLETLVFAGSDATALPSKSEPCGLTQMAAHRLATVPIVRNTGGLADTVKDGQDGFLFEECTAQDFLSATEKAMEAYKNSEQWQSLQQNAMSADHSWHKSAEEYTLVYEQAFENNKKLTQQLTR